MILRDTVKGIGKSKCKIFQYDVYLFIFTIQLYTSISKILEDAKLDAAKALEVCGLIAHAQFSGFLLSSGKSVNKQTSLLTGKKYLWLL